jgi:hypothetical protein
MQLFPQDRSTVGYMALVVLLAGGLAIGVALFVLQARGPAGGADFVLSAGEGVECPTGSGAPACFRFDLTNAGSGPDAVECVVVPGEGGTAVFTASGSDLYRSDGPVAVGDTYSLYTEVRLEGSGTKDIGRPRVVCGVPG